MGSLFWPTVYITIVSKEELNRAITASTRGRFPRSLKSRYKDIIIRKGIRLSKLTHACMHTSMRPFAAVIMHETN